MRKTLNFILLIIVINILSVHNLYAQEKIHHNRLFYSMEIGSSNMWTSLGLAGVFNVLPLSYRLSNEYEEEIHPSSFMVLPSFNYTIISLNNKVGYAKLYTKNHTIDLKNMLSDMYYDLKVGWQSLDFPLGMYIDFHLTNFEFSMLLYNNYETQERLENTITNTTYFYGYGATYDVNTISPGIGIRFTPTLGGYEKSIYPIFEASINYDYNYNYSIDINYDNYTMTHTNVYNKNLLLNNVKADNVFQNGLSSILSIGFAYKRIKFMTNCYWQYHDFFNKNGTFDNENYPHENLESHRCAFSLAISTVW